VLGAIREVGYSPSFAAQALRARSTRTIALVTLGEDESLHFDRAYFGRALNGVLRALQERKYTTLIHQAESGELESLFELFEHGRIDGALVLAASSQAKDLATLSKAKYPIALIDRRSVSLPCAHGNYGPIMGSVVEHVVGVGAKRLLYLAGKGLKGSSGAQRLSGFEQAASRLGVLEASCVIETDWSAEAGREATRAVFEESKRAQLPFDAIVAASDDLALGALRAAKELSLDVPGDIRLTGFDDSTPGSLSDPTLTTVSVPIENMAEEAATRLVLSLTEQPFEREHRVELELVVRESCGSRG